MKIGKRNVDRFFPNCIDREKEIRDKLISVVNKIMKNAMYESANYIICSSSLVKELKDAVDK